MQKKSIIFLGSAELGFFLTEISIRLYLLKFYTDVIGLEPYLAGIAISIGLLWDAISDPLMGYLSDHYPITIKIKNHLYRKKRIFYILFGSFFLGIFMFLLFSPAVKDQNSIIKFLYLSIHYILLNTFFTISAVPHSALCGEATMNSLERNQIFGFRLFWGNIGLITGIILPVIFTPQNPSNYFIMNFIILLIIFISSLISFFAGFDLDNPDTKKVNVNPKIFFKSIKSLFKNQYFIILLLCYFFGYIAIGMNSNIALYYYEYFLKFTNTETSFVLLVFLIVWTISIPIWIYFSKVIGKKKSIFFAIFFLGTVSFHILFSQKKRFSIL